MDGVPAPRAVRLFGHSRRGHVPARSIGLRLARESPVVRRLGVAERRSLGIRAGELRARGRQGDDGGRVRHRRSGETGGLTDRADRGQTNLAAPVADGDHVHVAGVGEQTGNSGKQTGTPGSRGRGAAGAGSPGKRLSVNINTADAAELQRLPGVGPATAAAIVTWREKNGPFRSVDDLLDVSGIGKATLSKIRDSVRI